MSCLHVGKPEAQRADTTARGLAGGRAEKHPENKWNSRHNEADMYKSPHARSQGAQEVNHRTYIKKAGLGVIPAYGG